MRRRNRDRCTRLPVGPYVLFAKPVRDLLKCRDEFAVIGCYVADARFEREPTDPFGLARFGLFQLLLEPADFFPDP